MRKVLFVADEQIPYQIDLGPLNKFIKDFQPDVLCRLGDMLDMTALTGWTSLSPEHVDWDDIRIEINIANKILDEQDALLPRHCEKHFWFGNHEERLAKFREKHRDHSYWRKNSSSIPYLMRDLKLKERGYRTHGQNDAYPIGKLYAFHGDDYGTAHLRNNLIAYGVNLVYGHVHSPARWTMNSRINSSPRSAWSLGCLCTRNPTWKNGSVNMWANGFGVAYVRDDGHFQMYPVDIVKGQFVAPSGKIYR